MDRCFGDERPFLRTVYGPGGGLNALDSAALRTAIPAPRRPVAGLQRRKGNSIWAVDYCGGNHPTLIPGSWQLLGKTHAACS